MSNRWKIPAALEQEVRARDIDCVYCRRPMLKAALQKESKAQVESWEHIDNDPLVITAENIVLCCGSCNSSKGAKALADWLKSPYCKSRGIDTATVADVVKAALPSCAVTIGSEWQN